MWITADLENNQMDIAMKFEFELSGLAALQWWFYNKQLVTQGLFFKVWNLYYKDCILI